MQQNAKERKQLEEQQSIDRYCESVYKEKEDVRLLKVPVVFTMQSVQIPIVKYSSSHFTPFYLDDNIATWRSDWINLDYAKTDYTTDYIPYFTKDTCRPELDTDWFRRQLTYMDSFDKKNILTVHSYTLIGDDIITPWLLGTNWWKLFCSLVLNKTYRYEYFPMFYAVMELAGKKTRVSKLSLTQQSFLELFKRNIPFSQHYQFLLTNIQSMTSDSWKPFWNQVLTIYTERLTSIIEHAPPLTHCLTTWRGSKTPYWMDSKNEYGEFVFKNYTSVSIDIAVTEPFREDDCCLLKITLPKTTPCLFLSPFSSFRSEAEILLSPNKMFMQDKRYGEELIQTRNYLLPNKTRVSNALCDKPSKIKVSFLMNIPEDS